MPNIRSLALISKSIYSQTHKSSFLFFFREGCLFCSKIPKICLIMVMIINQHRIILVFRKVEHICIIVFKLDYFPYLWLFFFLCLNIILIWYLYAKTCFLLVTFILRFALIFTKVSSRSSQLSCAIFKHSSFYFWIYRVTCLGGSEWIIKDISDALGNSK